MASEQEDFMTVDTSMFAQVIQEHLELKRRNAALEHELPLGRYLSDDPFENHPLFKTEEQPTTEDTFIDEPQAPLPVSEETQEAAAPAVDPEPSDENLWSRSRDFDWGD
jgi:hypothetical protein